MPLLAQSIGLDTLSKYFHLPINDVAKELGVCATVLKKICRKNGIPRWPHRKIKSLDKMITTLEVSVAKNPEDEERIRQEIQTLKNKRMFLMKNPNVLAAKPVNMKKPKSPKRLQSNPKAFEANTDPSFSLNPMAAALYSQLSHPYIPHPVPVPVVTNNFSCPIEAIQWVPGDHPSAFVPTKSIHHPPGDLLQGEHPSLDSEQCAVPEPMEFPIHLPELRNTQEDYPAPVPADRDLDGQRQVAASQVV